MAASLLAKKGASVPDLAALIKHAGDGIVIALSWLRTFILSRKTRQDAVMKATPVK